MKKLSISIVGCGWLGMPLLVSLVAAGHRVTGSSRDLDRLADIQRAGGKAFPVDLPGRVPAGFAEGCEVLIIALPPNGRRLGERTTRDYLEKLAGLRERFLRIPALRVIFISSTGVYGNATQVVTERTEPTPNTESGKAVIAAERLLTELFPDTIILRLAGLIGPGRHPGRFYGGRDRPIPLADAPVNLVHRDDVIAAIHLLLENYLFKEQKTGRAYGPVQKLFGMEAKYRQPVFNVCAAAHPRKRDFYKAAAGPLKIAGYTAGGADGKIIDSFKLRGLGWLPKWDDLSFNRF